MAVESKEFNIKDKYFSELFPELVEEIIESFKKKELEEKLKQNDQSQLKSSLQSINQFESTNGIVQNHQNWIFSLLSNMVVMIGIAAFAFVVKHVFNTIN